MITARNKQLAEENAIREGLIMTSALDTAYEAAIKALDEYAYQAKIRDTRPTSARVAEWQWHLPVEQTFTEVRGFDSLSVHHF